MRNHTRAVRIWIPDGDTVHGVCNDLQRKIDGLILRDSDGRSFRVDCPSTEVQDKLPRFNEFYLEHVHQAVKVKHCEISCTVAEICEFVDERVKETDE